MLISYCLVQSKAYPPVSELDEKLLHLVEKPKEVMGEIRDIDPQAAEMLRYYLSGYATLRRFYDLRDEDFVSSRGEKRKHQPLDRKKKAASALVAMISSSSDCIHGGLYDDSRDPVVQVDGLMALLGEALIFVGRKKTHSHGDLLANTNVSLRTPAHFDDCSDVRSTQSCRRLADSDLPGIRPM